MIKKLILSTACGLLMSSMIMNAQSRHELSILGGGGLSTFNYKTEIGSEKLGFGGHVGLGYSFFFNENFGIGTGAELTFYNSKFTGDFSSEFPTNVGDDYFTYRSTVNGYEEKQNAMFVNIPLMLQFQTNGKNKFYAALGGKLGIPITSTYQTKNTILQARGYLEQEQLLFGQNGDFTFLGLGDYEMGKEKKDLNLNLAYMLSAEIGMKWNLKNSIALYTGVYADYGLNNIMKDKDLTFIDYNREQPEDFQVNSVLTSQYSDNNNAANNFTDKVAPLAVGLKIKVSFGLGKRFRDYHAEEREAAVQAISQSQDLTPIKDLLDKYRDDDEKRYQEMLQKLEDKEGEQEQKEQVKQELDQDRSDLVEIVDYYEVGATNLSATQQSIVDRKIEIMKQHPTWKIVLVGHTCDLGAAMTNKNVGQERADAVKAYMVKNGIASDRIISVSRGMDEPVVPNTDDANRHKNRRVEFLVTQY